MKLTVLTYNNEIPSRSFMLPDVKSIEYTTAHNCGYLDATIELTRKPGRNYTDLGPNYHVNIITPWGETVWEGFINAMPQSDGFNIEAVGYYSRLSDITSGWLPYYPDPNTYDIAQIVLEGINGTPARYGDLAKPGYVKGIVATAATVPNTGRKIEYEPENAASVSTHLEEILKYGDSLNRTLHFQVWNGRKLYLSYRPDLSSNLKYRANLRDTESNELGVNADTFFNRVTVKYQDFFEVLSVTEDNLPMQSKYRSSYGSNDPTFAGDPLIREAPVVDVTSHGIIDETQARAIAKTILNRYSKDGIRLVASSATFKKPGMIRDNATGAPIHYCQVKANNGILWTDLLGANTNLLSGQSSMFVGQTRYTNNQGEETFEITSEENQSVEELLSAVLSNTDSETE